VPFINNDNDYDKTEVFDQPGKQFRSVLKVLDLTMPKPSLHQQQFSKQLVFTNEKKASWSKVNKNEFLLLLKLFLKSSVDK